MKKKNSINSHSINLQRSPPLLQAASQAGLGSVTAVTRSKWSPPARGRRRTCARRTGAASSCRSLSMSWIGSQAFSSERLKFYTVICFINRNNSDYLMIGIRDFYSETSDRDIIIAMDYSEHIGFTPFTRK